MKSYSSHEESLRPIGLKNTRTKSRCILLCLLCVILFFRPVEVQAAESSEPLSLYQRSIQHDISSSTMEALTSWILSLGLEPARHIEQNRRILTDWYDLSSPVIPVNQVENGGNLTIHHTNDMRMISPVGTKTELLVLTGLVDVSLSQTSSSGSLRIQADAITIHIESGIVYAQGDVRYSTESSSESSEELSAEHIVFHLTSEFGVFMYGELIIERRSPEAETITFIIRGESIERDSDGHIIIEQGSISTDPIDPYISIHADTIKILSGGDWFAAGAVLSIGHVPLVYLPFFYYPGNTLFINPSFGITLDRGFYINTTMHILGTPPSVAANDSTSFASYITSEQEVSVIGIDGRGYEGLLAPAAQEWAAATSSYMDITCDVYEKQGVVLGSNGSLEIYESARLTYLAAIGYDPISLPASLGVFIEPEITMTRELMSLTLKLPWYSNPDIVSDYSRRRSKFDIQDLFRATDLGSESSIGSFIWELDTTWDFRSKEKGVLFETLSIPTLSQEMRWSFDNGTPSLSGIVLMDHDIRIAGTLFRLGKAPVADKNSDNVSEILLENQHQYLPAIMGGEAALHQSFEQSVDTIDGYQPFEISIPTIKPDTKSLPINAPGNTSDHTAETQIWVKMSSSYSLRDRGAIEISVTEESLWEYAHLSGQLTGSLTTIATTSDSNYAVSYTLLPRLVYSSHANYALSLEDYQELSDDDLRDTSLFIRGDLMISIEPLGMDYHLRNEVGELTYDEVLGYHTWAQGSWDSEDITEHAITGTLRLYESPKKDRTLRATYRLPLPPDVLNARTVLTYTQPAFIGEGFIGYAFDQDTASWAVDSIVGKVQIRPFLRTTLTMQGNYDVSRLNDPELTGPLDPLTISLTGSYETTDKALILKQRLYLDMSHPNIDSSISEVTIDDLKVQFTTEWLEDSGAGSPGVVPSRLRMQYTGELPRLTMWKNRMSMDFRVFADWEYDFQQTYDNLLSITCEANLSIFEFLDLTITTTSLNTSTDRYMTGQVNPLWDLIRSFNFFSLQDRYASGFKLDTIEVALVHHMRDWDLYLDYSGSFAYSESDNVWRWDPSASIYITWKAFPEIDLKTTIEHDTESQSSTIIME